MNREVEDFKVKVKMMGEAQTITAFLQMMDIIPTRHSFYCFLYPNPPYAHTHTHTHTRIHTHTHTHTCIHTHAYTHMHTHTCIHTHTRARTHQARPAVVTIPIVVSDNIPTSPADVWRN